MSFGRERAVTVVSPFFLGCKGGGRLRQERQRRRDSKKITDTDRNTKSLPKVSGIRRLRKVLRLETTLITHGSGITVAVKLHTIIRSVKKQLLTCPKAIRIH